MTFKVDDLVFYDTGWSVRAAVVAKATTKQVLLNIDGFGSLTIRGRDLSNIHATMRDYFSAEIVKTSSKIEAMKKELDALERDKIDLENRLLKETSQIK